ncbi:MAG: DUF664 domain-containing protein [Acidimicrobiales bacterium]|nr:DUF664 domain-containing protein [Acidimicrobiales bacterium]
MSEPLWSIHQTEGVRVPIDDFEAILDGQRARFAAVFGDLDADRWRSGTRCSDWNAHTVMRHLTDAVEVHLSGFTGVAPDFVEPSKGFDPQVTPDEWLTASAGESPAATLDRYDRAARAIREHALADYRAGVHRIATGPYGPAHWSVITVHILWDAWLHERDVFLVDGEVAPPSISGSASERTLVALYSTLMATVPGHRVGRPLAGTIELEADRPVWARFGGEQGALEVAELEAGPAPDLRGVLPDVIDSIGGRGRPLAEVLSGPPAMVESMAILGAVI